MEVSSQLPLEPDKQVKSWLSTIYQQLILGHLERFIEIIYWKPSLQA